MDYPCPISEAHDSSDFDCGVEALNVYLKRYARQTQRREGTRTYVVAEGHRVVAYYTIVFGGIDWSDAPEEVRKGLGKYPIPIMEIACLAVDKDWTGKKLGKSLLIDALGRAILASEIAGLRAVCVDAKDEAAKSFDKKNGFRAWPTSHDRLFVTMIELKRESALGKINNAEDCSTKQLPHSSMRDFS